MSLDESEVATVALLCRGFVCPGYTYLTWSCPKMPGSGFSDLLDPC